MGKLQGSKQAMKFKIANIQSGTINGIGISLEIWFQGCKLNCLGCQNPELQDFSSGIYYDTNLLLEHIKTYNNFYNSIVYLGGEPLCQPKALYEIASKSKLPNILYTGYNYSEIPDYIKDVMYVIVAGPYKEEFKIDGFPITANQEIYIDNILTIDDFRKNY